MRTYFDCIPCIIRHTVDSARMTTNDQQAQEKILREVLSMVCKMDFNQTPPVMTREVHRLIRELTGVEDQYLEIRNRFNSLALQMYPDLKERIETSADPLETAVRLAVVGNIIDFGANPTVEHSQIEQAIAQSLTLPLDMEAFRQLRNSAAAAKDILYIGDNSGEIVFDRLLIEQLPYQKITFVVRGSPILNDVVMEDARVVGLTDIVDVIDNGSDAPGTILDICSEQFRRRFDEADLLIAKGQGNYETLTGVEKEIFFLLQPKCAVLARHLDCEVGSLVLVKNKPGIRD